MQLRKQALLEPKDKAVVTFMFAEGEVLEAIREGGEDYIKDVRAQSLELVTEWAQVKTHQTEIEIGGEKGKVALEKIDE